MYLVLKGRGTKSTPICSSLPSVSKTGRDEAGNSIGLSCELQGSLLLAITCSVYVGKKLELEVQPGLKPTYHDIYIYILYTHTYTHTYKICVHVQESQEAS